MVLIFYNSRKPLVRKILPGLRALLKKKGHRLRLIEARGLGKSSRHVRHEIHWPTDVRLAVSLGGDGTLLAAARQVVDDAIPLMGINLGGLGFLAAADQADWSGALEMALDGRLPTQDRLVLSLRIERAEALRSRHLAVNDCVLRTEKSPRMLEIQIALERQGYLAHLRGDGLIVATPTGSTAYALAAGGPIVEPCINAYVLVPLAAHTLTQRPLLVGAHQALRLSLGPYHGEPGRAMVFVDGQITEEITSADTVIIETYPKNLILLRSPKRGYFHLLREKLHWASY
ncbi:MAG: NAD(+)/NADH kinase [Elusimicrobiota bacterium]